MNRFRPWSYTRAEVPPTTVADNAPHSRWRGRVYYACYIFYIGNTKYTQ